MKEIVVLSGKGGTGKTSIAGSLAVFSADKVMADCDVYGADLRLLLEAVVKKRNEFHDGYTCFIDEEKCIQCGRCEEVCRFGAIHDVISNCSIDAVNCDGCGFCYNNCLEKAIVREDQSADWFISDTEYGPLVYGGLRSIRKDSSKLVTLVRQQAKLLVENQGLKYVITDGPPGTGSQAIASLSGADLALLVTEPTLSGIQGLGNIARVCQQFNVPAIVCINKHDVNEQNTRHIQNYCRSQGIDVAAMIPFDNVVNQALLRGLPVAKYRNSDVSRQIKELWGYILRVLN